MIVFDLRCAHGHVFEGWFGSSADYDAQRARGLVQCPLCGGSEVERVLSAPRISGTGEQPSNAEVKQMLGKLAQAQARALEKSEWVGGDFARRACAMHDGDQPHARIHGQATVTEAKALADDGVPVAPLPLPVVPPGERN